MQWPPHTDPAATPYADIRYDGSEEAVRFHAFLLENVSHINFKILPIKYREEDFKKIITKKDHFIHYYLVGEHEEDRVNEFWEWWRKVLREYKKLIYGRKI